MPKTSCHISLKTLMKKLIFIFCLLLCCFDSISAQVFKLKKGVSKKAIRDSIRNEQKKVFSYFNNQLDSLKNHDDGVKENLKDSYQTFYKLYQDEIKQAENSFKSPKFGFQSLETSLTQQIAHRKGNYTYPNPAQFTRFQIQARGNILFLPVTIDGLFTDEQTIYRQPMNRLNIGLDLATLKRNTNNKIRQRIQQIKKISNPEGLLGLDKLYALFNSKDFPFKNTEELKNYLNEYDYYNQTKEKTINRFNQLSKKAQDSLQNIRSSLEKKAKTKAEKKLAHIKSKKDAKTQILKAKIENISTDQKKSPKIKQSKKAKKNKPKGQKKILHNIKKEQPAKSLHRQLESVLKEQNLDIEQLKKLIKLRDSLQKFDIQKLAGVKSVISLEQIQKEETLDGLKVLRNTGVISRQEFILKQIKRLEFGTTFPYYTPYTLRNIPVTGLNVEVQPDQLYAAFTASKNLRALPEQGGFARDLQAGRIGFGSSVGKHVHFTFLQAEDDRLSFDSNNLLGGFADTSFYDKPRKNYLWGMDAQWNLGKNLDIKSEIVQSVTAMNTFEQNISTSDAFGYFGEFTDENAMVQSGLAISLGLDYRFSVQTKLSILAEQIDPEYFSLGAPFLRNDLRGYKTSLEQQFLQGKITITPSFAQYKDNLNQHKTTTTLLTTYGLRALVQFPKLPYIQVDYQFNQVKNIEDNNIQTLNANLGYQYRISQIQFQTNFNVTHTDSKIYNPDNESLNPFLSVKSYTFNQSAFFRNSLKLSAQVTYINNDDGRRINNGEVIRQNNFTFILNRSGFLEGHWLNSNVSLGYTFWGVWENQFTYLYGFGEGNDYRQSIQFQSKVPIIPRLQLLCEFESHDVDIHLNDQRYQEVLGRFTLKYVF